MLAIELGVQLPDEAAVARLYELHAAAVYAYARRRSDTETAEEVTARVFVVAWRRRESVPADALPWLYGVARRVLAEERRSQRRRVSLRMRLRDVGGDSGSVDAVADGMLGEALGRLSDGDREVLLLRYWEELSTEQLAVALGCSRSAVAVRVHRARTRLSRALVEAGAPLGGAGEVTT